MASLSEVVGRATTDAAFRAELLKDPRNVLVRAGVPLPAGVSVQAFANDARTFHAALPTPQNKEMLAFVRTASPLAAKVYERAWSDAAFKQRLMTQPRQAFIEATGVTPPASLNLVAHEDTPQLLNVVVPHTPPAGELSDADLEQVAGGKGVIGAIAPGTGGGITPGAGPACLGPIGGGATIGMGLGPAVTPGSFTPIDPLPPNYNVSGVK